MATKQVKQDMPLNVDNETPEYRLVIHATKKVLVDLLMNKDAGLQVRRMDRIEE